MVRSLSIGRQGMLGVAMIVAATIVLSAIGPGSTTRADDPEALKKLATSTPKIAQIRLTKASIGAFLKAWPALKAQLGRHSPDARRKFFAGAWPAEAEEPLRKIAGAHGFRDLTELRRVAWTIAVVLHSFEPETGEPVDPKVRLEHEIEAIQADMEMPEEMKTELADEIRAKIASLPAVEHRENLALVAAQFHTIQDVVGWSW